VFWLASFVFVSAAICLHLAALRQAGRGVQCFTQAMNGTTTEDQRQSLKAESHRFFQAAEGFRFTGMAAVFLSIVGLVVSNWKNEPAPRSIILAAMVFYSLLLLAVV
jgi:hypothetical protein